MRLTAVVSCQMPPKHKQEGSSRKLARPTVNVPVTVENAVPAQQWGGTGGAVLRSMSRITLPRWQVGLLAAANISFFSVHDSSAGVIVQGNRGEALVVDVFRLLAHRCAEVDGGRGHHVLDIGANLGFYSMLAGAHGCRVTAFEPQPGCAKYFHAARRRNNFSVAEVRLVPHPLGPGGSTRAPVVIDAFSCWSMAAANVAARGKLRNGKVAVETISIDAALPSAMREGFLLAKVDVEGAELGVLETLMPLLPRIDNLLVETSPGWWAKFGAMAERNRNRTLGARFFASLLEAEGGGFAAARTSTGRVIRTPRRLFEYLMSFPKNGYWGQVDMWLTKDASFMRQSERRLRYSPHGFL